MSSTLSYCKASAAVPSTSAAARQVSKNVARMERLYKSQVPSKLPVLITKYSCPRVLPEPVPVSTNDILSLVQFERQEQRLQEEIGERERRINDIISSLKIMRESVEKAFGAQMVTQMEIEQLNPSEDRERLKHLLQLKCRQQQELMECIQMEDKYLHDLQCEQKALHEMNVKSQSLLTDKIDRKIDEIYLQYEGRKDYLYRSRLQRESETRKNAKRHKYRAARALIETTLEQKLAEVEEQRERHPKPAPPPALRREVVKKVRYRLRVNNLRYRRGKEEAILSHQGRQYKQRQALMLLKERIEQQRLELEEQNQAHAKKREEEQRRKEAHRQKLLAMGENPYVVDELMRVEAKIRAKERRAAQIRALAIEKIQREVIDRERAYRKAMASRKKWDRFWAQKAKERKMAHYEKFVKPFLAEQKPSRSERWLKIAQETYGYEPGKPPPCLKVTEPRPATSNSNTAAASAPATPLKDTTEEDEPAVKESQQTITTTAQKGAISSKSASPRRVSKFKKKSMAADKGVSSKPRGSRGKKESDDATVDQQKPEETSEASEVEQPAAEEAKSKPSSHNTTATAYTCAIIGPYGDVRSLAKDNLSSPTMKTPLPITDAFTWSPPVIKFENYDIGKTYRLRVYVTNKSRQRLKYYFREMIESGESSHRIPPNPPPSAIETTVSPKPSSSNYDSDASAQGAEGKSGQQKTPRKRKKLVSLSKTSTTKHVHRHPSEVDEALKAQLYHLSDAVKVNFTVPFPLNPGLQHSFEVVFKPKAQGDWFGLLKFTSELGNFDIPIEVLKRRFMPELDQAELLFTDTVVQTGVVKKIKLKNTGGLHGFLHHMTQPEPPRNYSEIDAVPSVQVIKAPNPSMLTEESGDEATGGPGKSTKKTKRKSKLEEVRFDDETATTTTKPPKSARKEDVKPDLPVKYASTKEFKVSSSMHMRKSPVKSKSSRRSKGEGAFVKDILEELISYVTDSVFVTYIDEMKREMKPGGELTLSVVYRPPFVSNFTSKLELDLGKYRTDPPNVKLTLDLIGTTVENPVYIQPLNGDFRICTVNNVYQLMVNAHTAYNKGAGRVRASVPQALRGYVEVFPQEPLTLYSTRPCEFAVYFHPRRLMLTSPELFREYFDPETRIIDFPIYFHLKFPYKVPSPIKATFMAVISDSLLTIQPEQGLDMGECHPAETVRAELTVTNPTVVAQKIGFTDLPDEIMIQPNYGFATVLPDESVKFEVLLTPDMKTAEGAHTFHLKLESFGREEYKVQVSCVIKRPIVKLSQYRVLFPSTCNGSTASTTVGIKHIGPPHKGVLSFPTFQIDLDPSLPLKISPQSGFLEPGKESKLFISFEPVVTVDDVRQTVVQVAQERHNELISSYQRELAAIEMHLQNEWMLDELANSPNPQLPPATSKTHISSIPSLQLQPPPPASTRPSTVKLEASTTAVSSKGRKTAAILESKSPKPPDTAKSDDAKSGSSGSKEGRKRSRPSTAGASNKADAAAGGKSGAKGAKGKRSLGEALKGKKGKKSTVGKANAPKSDEEMEESLTPKQRIIRELEKRRKYVLTKVSMQFTPPDVRTVSPDSLEFNRAKREYLRRLTPFSRVYQVPIIVRDAAGMSTETAILTLSCPTQRPDLILLDDASVGDFGQVNVGGKKWKEIHVFNSSESMLKLKISVLNPYGPFIQANALRDLAPEHVYTLKIRLEPTKDGEFQEQLIITGGESRLSLTLKGSAKVGKAPSAPPSRIYTAEYEEEEEELRPTSAKDKPGTAKSRKNSKRKSKTKE